MKNPTVFLLLVIVVSFFPVSESASKQEQRVALLIGNSHYEHGGSLDNPVNDVRAMKKALEGLGFTVMKYENCSQKAMKKAMDRFGRMLKGKDVGLFFYAGHGIRVGGRNYLLPVNVKLDSEDDVEYDCVRADRVLAKMETAGSRTNIVILDACRDNPFERSWRRGTKGAGLAFMKAPSGSLIAYSTAPEMTASDGGGKNSPYTAALLQHINTPGITILQMFQKVRSSVREWSGKKQTPWESTSLTGDFYFAGNGRDVENKGKTVFDTGYGSQKPDAWRHQDNQVQHQRTNKGSIDITAFRHSKGVFKHQGKGRWFEYWDDFTYSFVEKSRDASWLYLRDDSRNMDLRLPIRGGWCQLRVSNRPWGNLYFVHSEYRKKNGLAAFRHSKGVFKQQAEGRWFEYWSDPTYTFVEKSRDASWLYLRDDSRNMDLRLPVKGGWCQLKTNNRPWGNLYFVHPE